MKKYIAMLLVMIMAMGLLTGCGSASDGMTIEAGKLIMSTNAAFLHTR